MSDETKNALYVWRSFTLGVHPDTVEEQRKVIKANKTIRAALRRADQLTTLTAENERLRKLLAECGEGLSEIANGTLRPAHFVAQETLAKLKGGK